LVHLKKVHPTTCKLSHSNCISGPQQLVSDSRGPGPPVGKRCFRGIPVFGPIAVGSKILFMFSGVLLKEVWEAKDI